MWLRFWRVLLDVFFSFFGFSVFSVCVFLFLFLFFDFWVLFLLCFDVDFFGVFERE